MEKFKNTIEKYLQINNQVLERYNSWNHCYSAFENHNDVDLLSLHLGFYLASWGMYRGSSGLLQKDYKIHTSAVGIIKDNWDLRCTPKNEVSHYSISKILKITNQLQNHYKSFQFQTLKGITKYISPTDTLISKILLGTLGCVPAFDRFFIEGVQKEGEKFKSLSERSLIMLFDYVEAKSDLRIAQHDYPQYPQMKLIDIFFWQLGFDHSRTDNNK